MVDYLFLSKELARIHAIADVRNKASQRVLEKAGFQREGTMRKCVYDRGELRDYYLYSILREEWKEPKVNETKPKKVLGRSVAIALGIICILLIAFIAYFSITGISAQNSYNNLQNQNKQLQTWLDGNETLLNQTQANNTNLQNQIDSLNSNITNLQNQANNFHIGNTENSTIWVNNKIVQTNENVSIQTGENTSVVGIENVGWGTYVPSAGYVSIRVSSNNNSTYVGLGAFYILNNTNINGTFIITYTNINSTNFNSINITSTYIFFPTYYQVGFGGTVVFPVLPTSSIEIYFGSSIGEATLTVTITYYY